VFPGFQPIPREFLNGRQYQGALDFRYNVMNKEYELSMIVARDKFEDDQTGLTMARFSEAGEVWRTYKDSQFATLLSAGNVAGNTGWDGVVYHGDSRTIGSSGTIDNNIAQVAATGTTLTASEFLDMIASCRTSFLGFNDDQGRPFNTQAVTRLRAICAPIQGRAGWEAQNQTQLFKYQAGTSTTDTSTAASQSNEYGTSFIDGVDELAYLGSAPTEVYVSALGSARKPFIMQERTQLEVLIYSDDREVAKNDGVMFLSRQRYVMTYGEPRRNILVTVS
jgi:phage major head subunit gpT-like protein